MVFFFLVLKNGVYIFYIGVRVVCDVDLEILIEYKRYFDFRGSCGVCLGIGGRGRYVYRGVMLFYKCVFRFG